MDIYARIKTQVESEPCPVHHKYPIASIVNDNVVLTCCCTDFEIDCYNEIIDILQGKAVKEPEGTGRPHEMEQELENTMHTE